MNRLAFFVPSWHHADARGSSQGGRYRRQDGDGDVQDFLPELFLVHS